MSKYFNRLKDLRTDKDLTQAEVAEKFFLQVTQYRRYENGESDLPLEWAKKFARFYHVPIDYIAGINTTITETKIYNDDLNIKEKKLLKAYSENPKLQKAIDIILNI